MPWFAIVLALIIIAALAYFVNTTEAMRGMARTVMNLVMALLLIGMALWLINNFIPMAESIKTILNIFVVLASVVMVLKALNLWNDVVDVWHKTMHRVTHPAPVEPPHDTPKPSEQH